ncbi:MAG: octaprenyl diphosphate synthase, partial [Burkholderia sp.]|nr:octaprenyl diphosphate synthase [Burkholderia sp.]
MSSTASPTLSAARLLAPIASDMEQVNRVIRQSLASDVLLINQIAEYIIG